jgi:hypothetical protein
MDFDLKEVVTTLAVGAFLIFGIEFIALNFFGVGVSSNVAKKLATDRWVTTALAATLCFVFGMIVENASNKLVENKGWARLNRFCVLESDDQIKTRIYFSDFAPQAAKYGFSPPLPGNENAKCVILNKDKPESERVNAAKAFYYHAKSVVYRSPSYYDELKRIQMRVDFSRSLIAVSLVLILVVSLLLIYKLIILGSFSLCKSRCVGGLTADDRNAKRMRLWLLRKGRNRLNEFESRRIRKGRLIVAFVTLGLVFWLSIFAY